MESSLFNKTTTRVKSRLLFVIAIVIGLFASSMALADTKIRFGLDWLPGSYHAPFFIALYKGYYKAEGLDVTIDRGKGSVELVRQLASGVFDMGFPDINVLTQFNASAPNRAFPEVMMAYNQNPSAIFYLKGGGITTPKQLEGKTLGATANDSTFQLFPVFAELAGFDSKKVNVHYIDPSLRESLLAKKQVDAITGQIFRSVLDLRGRGVKEDDIKYFRYNNYGLDLYGNGVAASPAFLKQHPDAVRKFVRATMKAVKVMVTTPEVAVEATLQYEPLLNQKLESDRLKLALSCCIATPYVLKNGYGDVDPARIKRGIAAIAKGYGLAREPTPSEVFNASFLPPLQDRMLQ